MAKKMLIDATHPEETRVVVVDGNKVDDFDFESINKRQLAGNIYLAKVTRVEPSLQAAFVEYGGNRHGFLAFSEVHPDYYQIPIADREALLAEEAAEAKAREASDDEEAEGKSQKGRGRGRGGRNRRRGRPADQADDGAERAAAPSDDTQDDDASDDDADDGAKGAPEALAIAGLEVIDPFVGDDENGPSGLAMAEPDAPAGPGPLGALDPVAAEETALPEPINDPVADPLAPGAAAEAEDGDAPATPAASEDDAPEDDAPEDDAPDSPSKSLAESAGLDDGERVSEEVTGATGAAAGDTAKPAEDASAGAGAGDAPEDGAGTARTGGGDDDGNDDDDEGGATKRRRSRRKRRGGKSDEAADGDDAPSREADNGADDDRDDVDEPEQIGAEDTLEEAARARSRLRRRYKIQDVIKVRQILLVQVVKEERGNKGAALTTYLSLAGRYCVLMPNTARGGGISRKITNAADRKRLREITSGLDVPHGMGLIVRTAGAERTKAEIKRDYEFLLRQWEQIRELTLKSIAPTLIYEEGSLIKRSIRDLYSKEIDQILVEGDQGYREAKEYMKMLMPSHAKNVQPYTDQIPLFSRYQVESYLNGMFNPVVQLKSGGYIVIGITEALVAIDVNSGRATKQGSIEETALQTNLEAADEVARQLRLRDLAGLIVIDFIDMDENRNNRSVEKRMKERLKTDRARIQVGRISAFGLMEMSRQRLRPGMLEATTQPCPSCQGMGYVRSDESMALAILRELEEEGVRGRANQVTLQCPVAIANYLINQKRESVGLIEERHGMAVSIMADPSLTSPSFEIERSKNPVQKPPKKDATVVNAESAVTEDDVLDDVADADDETGDDEDGKARRRRGKRGGRRRRGQDGAEADQETGDGAKNGDDAAADAEDEDESGDDDRPKGRRSRGRRRGGRGRRAGGQQDGDGDGAEAQQAGGGEDAGEAAAETSERAPADAAPAVSAGAPEAQTGAAAVTDAGAETAGPAPDAAAADATADQAEAAAPQPNDVEAADAGTAPGGAAVDERPEAEEGVAPEAAPAHRTDAETDAATDAGTNAAGPEGQSAEPDQEPATAEPEPALADAAGTAPAPEPAPEPEPETPKRPRRRGWWSLGR